MPPSRSAGDISCSATIARGEIQQAAFYNAIFCSVGYCILYTTGLH
jgi:hypothetical protein